MPNTNTARLGLPYIQAAQAQKEVTHNQSLNLLDMFTRPVVKTLGTNTPPGSPTIGDCHIVGSSPTGAFDDHEQEIACYTANGWIFATPFKWLDVVNEDNDTRYAFNGTAWVPYGLLMCDSGEYLRVSHKQEEVTLSGGTTVSTVTIPDRSLVIAVNVRVTEAITGASAFSVGVSGDTTRYGNSLGIALDTTNIGLSYHPISYYASTALHFTAISSNFTGGKVRFTVQYLEPKGPWSW